MNKNIAVVPSLRFPEFSETWEKKPISSLLIRSKKAVQPIPNRKYREIGVRSHGRGVFHKDAVSGESLGDKRVFYVIPNALVLNIVFAWEQAVALTTEREAGFIASHRFPMFLGRKGQSYLPFILEILLTKRGKWLLGLASPGGAGRNKTLGQQDFLELKIWVPCRKEQKKIAAFLGAMDEKLSGLRRKRDLLSDYKRGAMQQIFSQQIRFKRDDGNLFPEWESRQLKEIAERRTTKNVDLSLARVLTNSAVQGVVDQGDFFDKDIANAENIGGYYVIEKGDFVYNPRISVTAPVGPIKQNKLGAGVMSPLYTIFRMNVRHVDFFAQYFDSDFWHAYMKSVANYGARHDRMAITNNDFMGMPLPWPHPDEQRKIADFLCALDAKIEAVAQQVTKTEAFKKGLLQQMFV